jgi:hypothetical protein
MHVSATIAAGTRIQSLVIIIIIVSATMVTKAIRTSVMDAHVTKVITLSIFIFCSIYVYIVKYTNLVTTISMSLYTKEINW